MYQMIWDLEHLALVPIKKKEKEKGLPCDLLTATLLHTILSEAFLSIDFRSWLWRSYSYFEPLLQASYCSKCQHRQQCQKETVQESSYLLFFWS